jgi:hypothetical protein
MEVVPVQHTPISKRTGHSATATWARVARQPFASARRGVRVTQPDHSSTVAARWMVEGNCSKADGGGAVQADQAEHRIAQNRVLPHMSELASTSCSAFS